MLDAAGSAPPYRHHRESYGLPHHRSQIGFMPHVGLTRVEMCLMDPSEIPNHTAGQK